MHSDTNYTAPVDQLLTYGDGGDSDEWPNYIALGLTDDHIPELIRMATDETLLWSKSDAPEKWAPTHAWRALGQLRAEAAIKPLLGLFHFIDERLDDQMTDELPKVLGMIGPAAVAPLGDYLIDDSGGLHARIAVSGALGEVGKHHPDARAACVAELERQLRHAAKSDPSLNAFVIVALTDLDSAESAPLIKRAFAAKAVDYVVMGDWEDVQVTLGLLERRQNPRHWSVVRDPATHKIKAVHKRGGTRRRKSKSKRKQAKKSRRKNRRR